MSEIQAATGKKQRNFRHKKRAG